MKVVVIDIYNKNLGLLVKGFKLQIQNKKKIKVKV